RILSCHDFAAGSVNVYGARHKRIFVHDIDLTGTRMGGEEIAALFGSVVGLPLTAPEFSLNGPVLSMEMHTKECAHCEWGKCARSAASLSAFSTGSPEQPESAGDTNFREFTETRNYTETRDFSTGSFFSGRADSMPECDRIPSGDTVSAFTGDGKQYMLLSDGMGTGRMAALTSGMAAVFLERMLTAGATMETALKMLNGVIRAGCDECAATVDLCEIDLVTMEARFVKSGAAPSFVIRDGSLFRLQSKTVPIGILRALDAEMIRFTVQPGDAVVMLSDGIARSFEECPWLLDFLSTDEDIQHGDVQRAAEKIVEQAAARGARDDITAGVMRIQN
ncbi:MAG: SpoIIE family protein phosphatase, partial [Clostridia bacterium]|nr:SpoIIE family protein phosphatase [Clostridia bacterium]